jgi:hypothetical protein
MEFAGTSLPSPTYLKLFLFTKHWGHQMNEGRIGEISGGKREMMG